MVACGSGGTQAAASNAVSAVEAPRAAAASSTAACAAPVSCAGTMSGSWCVDTFFPNEMSSPEFGGVWASGPNDVWAVGWRNSAQQLDANGFAFHWDGCSWSPAPLSTTAGLNDVWGAGSTDVWIAGTQGATWHWDGAAWTAVSTGASGAFHHLSGTGSADVWAIGNAGLYHWDGKRWTADPRLPVDAEDGFLGDIWAVAPDDVWVAEGFNVRGGVAHYDGAAWTVAQPSPEPNFGLFGVWSSGAVTWAVGEGNQALRNSAGSWTQLQPPSGSAQGWVNAMGAGQEVWASGQTVARATGDGFQKVGDVPPGFYPGLWLTAGQVWVAGISNAGQAVVMHRPR